ncbi:hypothetical protein [Halomonas caseinilytica]|uniref:hypothetical protein n=2 Tax=Halomonas caseinilytica TaxID=438744 RepID=UPI0008C4CA6E|nr:hypothetical protein [Halomonas caseinilytica]SEN71110.1 hypothetical protein SAMN04487952_1265 [Halomonas caseinilytica]
MPNINVRVSETEKAELEVRSKGNVSAYVRQQLFGQDRTLETILHRLEDIADDLEDKHTGAEERYERPDTIVARDVMPMLAELLLMMRRTVKPDTRKMAQSEIARVGMQVWESGNPLE